MGDAICSGNHHSRDRRAVAVMMEGKENVGIR